MRDALFCDEAAHVALAQSQILRSSSEVKERSA
jgi:hypothetical protein